jgi:hypothetical protein
MLQHKQIKMVNYSGVAYRRELNEGEFAFRLVQYFSFYSRIFNLLEFEIIETIFTYSVPTYRKHASSLLQTPTGYCF